jgi:hypothetical protein
MMEQVRAEEAVAGSHLSTSIFRLSTSAAACSR